tara:strand:- start:866 stop:1813 length:948 start_codon:yes stop_codon:yes gene_type:complete
MLFRLTSLSASFVFLFLFGACSDAPSGPTAAVQPEVEVAKPVLKTSGILRFDGLPAESLSAAEVLIVSALSDAARERLLRQRELFENKITGRVEDPAGVIAIEGMSPADAMQLEASLGALRVQFPPIRVEDVNLGNNRVLKFQSAPELFKEYQYLFASINWGNLERGLTFIADKMKVDNKALIAEADEVDEEGYQQIGVTLDWLKSVQQYLNSYVELAQAYVDAKNRLLQAQTAAASMPVEPADWDAYVAKYANTLIMDTSEYLLGAAFTAEDGLFEVKGHGIVIVRLELGLGSVYFLLDSDEEERVRIEELQQF